MQAIPNRRKNRSDSPVETERKCGFAADILARCFELSDDTPDGWRALTFYQLGALLHDLIMRERDFCGAILALRGAGRSGEEPFTDCRRSGCSSRPAIASQVVPL